VAVFHSSSPWYRSALNFLRGQTPAPEVDGIAVSAPAPETAHESPVARTSPVEEFVRADWAADPGATSRERTPVMATRGEHGRAPADQSVSPSPVARPAPATLRVPLTALQTTSVELIVSPFSSFRAVGHFQQILAGASGVHAARLRRLQHGVLQMRVECRDSTELIEGLRDACQHSFRFRVQSQEVHRIEVVLEVEADEEVTNTLL